MAGKVWTKPGKLFKGDRVIYMAPGKFALWVWARAAILFCHNEKLRSQRDPNASYWSQNPEEYLLRFMKTALYEGIEAAAHQANMPPPGQMKRGWAAADRETQRMIEEDWS